MQPFEMPYMSVEEHEHLVELERGRAEGWKAAAIGMILANCIGYGYWVSTWI